MQARLNKEVTVSGCTGGITTFVVEPFVPHAEEYYLSIQVRYKKDKSWHCRVVFFLCFFC